MAKDAIEGLEPKLLWESFYGITRVPRPSKKEEKIREHVIKWAEENNFNFREDQTGNIVIDVPATPGYENKPIIVLQGHLDMVCEKNKGTEHDFDNDPIEIMKEGDWIKAKGTTLGADNGIGVAAAMAAALDPEMVHGPLEILCTVDEETGMTGVGGLSSNFLKGKTLLNMDSEEDGAFYVGCAGGQDTVGVFDIQTTDPKKGMKPYELTVTGLKGGHSGLDIANGRANAIRLLAQLLHRLSEVNFRIAHIDGGSLRNAIPREAEVIIFIDPQDEDKINNISDKFVKESVLEFTSTDPGLVVNFKKVDNKYHEVFRKKFAKKLISCLLAIPHGIMAMNHDIPGLVDTSTNLATVKIEGDSVKVGTSQRSSIESAKINITNMVASVFELADAEVKIGDGYPGWQPNMKSELLKTGKKVFAEQFGVEPEVKAIHAGLETGLLGSKYPGMDMISFGPTIEGAHSPDEKINVVTVEKFYKLLKGILAEYAK
ncbi:MAG: aminoacyl-histidine dipeptidase [Melioribacteraceae bacterium]|nr:aminoacyl-histidine dipeptidase [Melioribacteraceae bacterium]MCF8355526.1 aminoacyl-histidine dipeptidase [Melioribacteraceae bacterium]MCF8394519.1 aminoacyl-histidine dipeptidase [Melioribacteraceae bacterium]MCF8420135.1 aminoacyl-histidine dipeptidase [Melioribacteraceae bacterium]